MLGRKQEFYSLLSQIADALLLGLALWLSHGLRELLSPSMKDVWFLDFVSEIPPFSEMFWMLAILMPFGPLLLESQGFYQHQWGKRFWDSLAQILRAGVWVILLIGLSVIFLRLEVPSRSVLIILCLIAPALLLARERVVFYFYENAILTGELRENVLLVGEPKAMDGFWSVLPRSVRMELNVVERVDLLRSSASDLSDALHRHSVGRVILCFRKLQMEKVQEAITACELEGVEAWLDAGFIQTSVAKPGYERIAGKTMLVFRATPDISWGLFFKEVMDRTISGVALLFLLPLFLAVALAIRLDSRGPVFFRQQRCGLHGKKFTIFKFRSMVVDAPERRAELESQNEMSGPVFKVTSDPRVTRLGKWLRKLSIDELPQLYNVLRGDMSLVGPRPLPDYEVARFDQLSHRRRLSMKPGITCLWQVRGRNKVTSFEDWVRMDLEYIDNWSLGLDLLILLRTIPAVLSATGAK